MISTVRLSAIALMALVAGSGCSPKSQLDAIVERGELRVATRNAPTTYFIDREGETGMEYEMAQRFAERIDVSLDVIVLRSNAEIIHAVASGRADIAAAALPQNFVEQTSLAPGPAYHWVTHQVVYRNGRPPPRTLDDIFPDQLHLMAGSIPETELAKLREEHPKLSWYIHKDKDTSELLDMIENGSIAYTVLPSNDLAHARQIRPEIRATLAITPPEPLVWGLRADSDGSLRTAIDGFVSDMEDSGELGALLDYFYGPVETFDYVDSRSFIRRIESRLPQYRKLFEEVALEHGMDWRLLAAISYQESHWNPSARSPTGVRGMMMLTLTTARRVGVNNRLDAGQSLDGGARYLAELTERVPKRIPEPDRTWFALAAYNVGMGHLEDARILTEKQGGDPDSWVDVRERLPLLSSSRWYKQTRFGYARGSEPVRFVKRIRRYYNVLVQLTQPETEAEQQMVEAALIDSPVL